jgi:hypothetical protein
MLLSQHCMQTHRQTATHIISSSNSAARIGGARWLIYSWEGNALCFYDSKTPQPPPQMLLWNYLTVPKAPTLQCNPIDNAWYEMAVLHPPAWLCSMQQLLPRRTRLGQSQIEETNCTERVVKKVQRPPKQSKVRSLHAGQQARQAKAAKQQVCD